VRRTLRKRSAQREIIREDLTQRRRGVEDAEGRGVIYVWYFEMVRFGNTKLRFPDTKLRVLETKLHVLETKLRIL